MSISLPRVVVFRPEPKASSLVCALMHKNIPSLAIKPFEIEYLSFGHVDCSHYSDFIFTSTFAVESFFNQHSHWQKPLEAKVWAIGAATAKCLLKLGIKAVHPQKADSENLLVEINYLLRNMEKRNFLLIKGIGGREYLTRRLKQQANSIKVLNCYKRVFITQEMLMSQIKKIDWQNQVPEILLYTSFDALKSAMILFDEYPAWRQLSIITVTNSRMLDWAKRQGFAKLYRLENTTHDYLMLEIGKLLQKDTM